MEELGNLKDVIIEKIPVKKIFLSGYYADGKSNDDSDLDIYVVRSD